MADFFVERGDVGVHAQRLVSNQVDTITFEGVYLPEVEIMTDGLSDIYVTFGVDSAPVIGAQHCWRVPAYAGTSVLPSRMPLRGTSPTTVVKLISGGAAMYSVSRSR